MTIVLKRKINYHLLQTYLPSGIINVHKVIAGWSGLTTNIK